MTLPAGVIQSCTTILKPMGASQLGLPMALARRFCKRIERQPWGLNNTSVFLDQARSTTDQSTRSTYFAKAGENLAEEETEMIVVTGATGNVGARTAELLRSRGIRCED